MGSIGSIPETTSAPVKTLDKEIFESEVLTLDAYQRRALSTAIYPGQGRIEGLTYTALGLGEAGEVQNKVKKVIRDDGGRLSLERAKQIAEELGGNLWYIAACAQEIGYSLQEIASMNLKELEGRAKKGTIQGDGDVRS